jgi:transposase
VELDPEEVIAAGGKGYRLVGEEVAHRVAYQRAGYIRLTVVRRKWARIDVDASPIDPLAGLQNLPLPPVVIAETPSCMWPRFMADPSAIANIIISKYGDILPLHRQETISAREGFALPRSTQCGWLTEAYQVTYRIVEAMATEALRSAFCIATDATGAPVKGAAGCEKWHVFVFAADRDHVFFRYTDAHSSANVSTMLKGFHGYVLADAATIYDVLYQPGEMVEVACWYHQRKYFWKALESDPARAYEALSLIAKLFRVARECADIPMPERTGERAARAGPILELFDRWIEAHRDAVDPRSPLDAAITYYNNQRDALRRFLEDGRLPLDNSVSERGLRNLVLGRANWLYFANETGLKWYCTFRSLIASCALHQVNPQTYLEQVLRLAPHWPVHRMIELAPKYWTRTLSRLDEHHRAMLVQPWDLESRVVRVQDSASADAA